MFILFLFVVSYIGVYLTPNITRVLFFVPIIYFFIKSKDNVPWIIFFFIYVSAPAALFYANHDRWFLYLTSSVGLPLSFAVSFAFLIKGLKERKKIRNRFAGERKIYFFYLFVLFFTGLIHGGLSFVEGFILSKFLPNILMILFLPLLIDLKKEYHRVKNLLYVFTIILFSIQIIEIILNKSLFGGKLYFEDGLQRNITGIYFAYFTMIISFTDLISRKSRRNLLVILAAISSTLILINSATRGWMISAGFIIVGFMILGNKAKTVLIGMMATALLALVLTFAPEKYMTNIYGSFNRLSSVLDVVEGNESAGGPRLTSRIPRVMNQHKKSPVFGFGFSDTTMEYYDGHVSNQSILMQSGFVGFILLYLIILSILWKTFKGYLLLGKNNPHRFRILAMIIGFLGIILIHFSSQQMYGYWMRGDKTMLLAFWFLFTFFYLDQARNYESK